ncbi:MAG: OmpH family outer membrane protein [Rickettsiales bacterium]|nr:MAG: OmpH family outer membrane protein [Rickettsiales bacterium]
MLKEFTSKIFSLNLVCAFGVLLLASIDACAEEKIFNSKIAVVDVESILEHSLAINHIKKTINNISNKIQNDFTQKEIELKEFEHELIKQRGVISEEDFNLKVVKFNKDVSVAQHKMQKKKIALEQAHSEAMAIVHKNTINVISKLSNKYGFDIVLPSAQVMFVKNNLNITLEVISELNEKLPMVEVKYNIDN